MSLNQEQTAKVKNAIKSKLVEIGAYVDDQLPDYVMIMITNKKTEKQMAEDLELFLSGIEQATSFSNWLHGYVRKLISNEKEINTNGGVNNASSTTTTTTTPTPAAAIHHNKKNSNSKQSSKTSNGTRTSSTSSNSATASSHSHLNSSNLTTVNATNESDELAIQIESNEFNDDFNEDQDKKSKTDSTSRSQDTSKSKKLASSTKSTSSGSSSGGSTKKKITKDQSKQKESISSKDLSDSPLEKPNELSKSDLESSLDLERSKKKDLQQTSLNTTNTSIVNDDSILKLNKHQNESINNSKSNESSIIEHQQPSKVQSNTSSSSSSTKPTSISSKVVAIVSTKSNQHFSKDNHNGDGGDDDEDEDEDFEKSKRKPTSLASVIKVSERKYTVPKSMQPNKSILLKAVDAANNSVQSASLSNANIIQSQKVKSIADLKLEEIRAKRFQETNQETNKDVKSKQRPNVPSADLQQQSSGGGGRVELFSQDYRHDKALKEDKQKLNEIDNLRDSSQDRPSSSLKRLKRSLSPVGIKSNKIIKLNRTSNEIVASSVSTLARPARSISPPVVVNANDSLNDKRRAILNENDQMESAELIGTDSSRIVSKSMPFVISDRREVQINLDESQLARFETENLNENSELTSNKLESKTTLSTSSLSSSSSSSNSNNININLKKEPKFIVTLNGLNDEDFLKKLNSKGSNEEQLELGDDESDLENYDQNDFEMNDDLNEYAMDDTNYENSQTMNDINPTNVHDENMDMEKSSVSQQQQIINKKKSIRCTFWPMCDKGENCPFLHPNKPCTVFPNCPFGQQCHYLHPSCRYDGYCARIDCPFTHVIKKPITGLPAESTPPQPASLSLTNSSSVASDTNELTTPNQSQNTNNESSQGSGISSKPIVTPPINVPSSTPASTAPKITINKIQPFYSLSNQTIQPAINNSISSPNVTEAVSPQTLSKTPTFTQVRAPRPAPIQGSTVFYKPGYSFPPNQYSLVNRSASSVPTVAINCKFGNMCKNPKCIYIHPNLPQKSQLKWTAALTNSTNLNQNLPSSNNTGNNMMMSIETTVTSSGDLSNNKLINNNNKNEDLTNKTDNQIKNAISLESS